MRCLDEAWHAAWSGGDRGRSWRLVAVSDGTTLGYDANGNVVTRTVGGVTWRYVYDPENRLREVWRGAERVATFRYDADGNRVLREVGEVRTPPPRTSSPSSTATVRTPPTSRTARFPSASYQKAAMRSESRHTSRRRFSGS